MNAGLDPFASYTTAGTYSIVPFDFFELKQFLNFLNWNRLLKVSFVGIKEVWYVGRDLFVFDEDLNFASGNVESHFVGAVHNKNYSAYFIFV